MKPLSDGQKIVAFDKKSQKWVVAAVIIVSVDGRFALNWVEQSLAIC